MEYLINANLIQIINLVCGKQLVVLVLINHVLLVLLQLIPIVILILHPQIMLIYAQLHMFQIQLKVVKKLVHVLVINIKVNV